MSPSTHQEVPESWPVHELWRLKWDPGKTLYSNPSAERTDIESETYIPVSALLSDEVVEALAKQRWNATGALDWDALLPTGKPAEQERVRARKHLEEIAAVIEQVGGGQGG